MPQDRRTRLKRGPAIATGAFRRNAHSHYRIRSEFLDSACAGSLEYFALPEALQMPPDESGAEGQGRRAEIERAVAAAESAGLQNYRVEMEPDGAITIVVGVRSPRDYSRPDIDTMAP